MNTKEKLLLIRRIVESKPRENVCDTHWFGGYTNRPLNRICCAIGHACFEEEGKVLGFEFHHGRAGSGDDVSFQDKNGIVHCGWNAVGAVLDIDPWMASGLFGNGPTHIDWRIDPDGRVFNSINAKDRFLARIDYYLKGLSDAQ